MEDIEKLREQAMARARSLDPRKNRKMGFAEFVNTIGLDRDADTEVLFFIHFHTRFSALDLHMLASQTTEASINLDATSATVLPGL